MWNRQSGGPPPPSAPPQSSRGRSTTASGETNSVPSTSEALGASAARSADSLSQHMSSHAAAATPRSAARSQARRSVYDEARAIAARSAGSLAPPRVTQIPSAFAAARQAPSTRASAAPAMAASAPPEASPPSLLPSDAGTLPGSLPAGARAVAWGAWMATMAHAQSVAAAAAAAQQQQNQRALSRHDRRSRAQSRRDSASSSSRDDNDEDDDDYDKGGRRSHRFSTPYFRPRSRNRSSSGSNSGGANNGSGKKNSHPRRNTPSSARTPSSTSTAEARFEALARGPHSAHAVWEARLRRERRLRRAAELTAGAGMPWVLPQEAVEAALDAAEDADVQAAAAASMTATAAAAAEASMAWAPFQPYPLPAHMLPPHMHQQQQQQQFQAHIQQGGMLFPPPPSTAVAGGWPWPYSAAAAPAAGSRMPGADALTGAPWSPPSLSISGTVPPPAYYGAAPPPWAWETPAATTATGSYTTPAAAAATAAGQGEMSGRTATTAAADSSGAGPGGWRDGAANGMWSGPSAPGAEPHGASQGDTRRSSEDREARERMHQRRRRRQEREWERRRAAESSAAPAADSGGVVPGDEVREGVKKKARIGLPSTTTPHVPISSVIPPVAAGEGNGDERDAKEKRKKAAVSRRATLPPVGPSAIPAAANEGTAQAAAEAAVHSSFRHPTAGNVYVSAGPSSVLGRWDVHLEQQMRIRGPVPAPVAAALAAAARASVLAPTTPTHAVPSLARPGSGAAAGVVASPVLGQGQGAEQQGHGHSVSAAVAVALLDAARRRARREAKAAGPPGALWSPDEARSSPSAGGSMPKAARNLSAGAAMIAAAEAADAAARKSDDDDDDLVVVSVAPLPRNPTASTPSSVAVASKADGVSFPLVRPEVPPVGMLLPASSSSSSSVLDTTATSSSTGEKSLSSSSSGVASSSGYPSSLSTSNPATSASHHPHAHRHDGNGVRVLDFSPSALSSTDLPTAAALGGGAGALRLTPPASPLLPPSPSAFPRALAEMLLPPPAHLPAAPSHGTPATGSRRRPRQGGSVPGSPAADGGAEGESGVNRSLPLINPASPAAAAAAAALTEEEEDANAGARARVEAWLTSALRAFESRVRARVVDAAEATLAAAKEDMAQNAKLDAALAAIAHDASAAGEAGGSFSGARALEALRAAVEAGRAQRRAERELAAAKGQFQAEEARLRAKLARERAKSHSVIENKAPGVGVGVRKADEAWKRVLGALASAAQDAAAMDGDVVSATATVEAGMGATSLTSDPAPLAQWNSAVGADALVSAAATTDGAGLRAVTAALPAAAGAVLATVAAAGPAGLDSAAAGVDVGAGDAAEEAAGAVQALHPPTVLAAAYSSATAEGSEQAPAWVLAQTLLRLAAAASDTASPGWATKLKPRASIPAPPSAVAAAGVARVQAALASVASDAQVTWEKVVASAVALSADSSTTAAACSLDDSTSSRGLKTAHERVLLLLPSLLARAAAAGAAAPLVAAAAVARTHLRVALQELRGAALAVDSTALAPASTASTENHPPLLYDAWGRARPSPPQSPMSNRLHAGELPLVDEGSGSDGMGVDVTLERAQEAFSAALGEIVTAEEARWEWVQGTLAQWQEDLLQKEQQEQDPGHSQVQVDPFADLDDDTIAAALAALDEVSELGSSTPSAAEASAADEVPGYMTPPRGSGRSRTRVAVDEEGGGRTRSVRRRSRRGDAQLMRRIAAATISPATATVSVEMGATVDTSVTTTETLGGEGAAKGASLDMSGK